MSIVMASPGHRIGRRVTVRKKQMQRILIVHEDAARAAHWAASLAVRGYPVATATSFQAGKGLLAGTALLITSIRLGAYNGLQLVIRGRLDYPRMAAIVTADVHDPALQAEAMKYGAIYLSGEVEQQVLLDLVEQALSDYPV